MIDVGGISYTKVRGRIAAYAYKSLDAFRRLGGAGSSINDSYVDGVSIIHGSPRNHVWTYAGGSTNYDFSYPEVGTNSGTKQPEFVDKNYYCAIAGQLVQRGSNGLFDVPIFTTLGNCVGDCPDDLTFCVTLDQATSDDLEVRVCTEN